MAAHLGKIAYPLLLGPSVMVDGGPRTHVLIPGIVRGVKEQDFNVRLRGKSERVDIVPQPPFA